MQTIMSNTGPIIMASIPSYYLILRVGKSVELILVVFLVVLLILGQVIRVKWEHYQMQLMTMIQRIITIINFHLIKMETVLFRVKKTLNIKNMRVNIQAFGIITEKYHLI